jgi:MFS family permease
VAAAGKVSAILGDEARVVGPAGGLRGALTRENARPQVVRDWRYSGWLAVGAVCFGAFMGQLDASIVTLTYAPLRAEFEISAAAVQWVSLAYLLALALTLVPFGRLADSRGRKLTYVYGFVVFTLASGACALAPNLATLVGLRVVQGAGASLLQASSVALVTTCAPAGRTRSALGVHAGAQALGLALGPSLGGLLVAGWGWRWVFAVNVPVGIVALAVALVALPRTRDTAVPGRVDRLGLLALAGALTGMLLALSAAAGMPLSAAVTAVLAVVTVGSTALLVRRLRVATHPLVDHALLADGPIRRGLVGAWCSYLLLFAPLVLVPSWLADHGVAADRGGFVLTALPGGFAVAATAQRALPASIGDRIPVVLGAAATTIGLVALLTVPPSPGPVAGALVVIGLALGLFTPANNAAVMGRTPAGVRATVGGTISMVRTLGTAAGVALVTFGLSHGVAGLDGPRFAIALLLPVAVLMLAMGWFGGTEPQAG